MERVRERMTGLDSYYSIHWRWDVMAVAGCNENSCFDQVFKFEIYFSKNWRPHTRYLYCQHLILTGVNKCQNKFICCLFPTYVHTYLHDI
jgi:hypothetical protein